MAKERGIGWSPSEPGPEMQEGGDDAFLELLRRGDQAAQLIPPTPSPVEVRLNGSGRITLRQGDAVIEVGNVLGLIGALQRARWIRDEAAKLDPIPETPTD